MSLELVSWSRRGIGAGTAAGAAGSRRLVTTAFTVTATPSATPPGAPVAGPPVTQAATSAPMAILGPGDVRGLDPTQIVRRCPRLDDHQFEPNYLAAVEFGHPDLPWVFSPVPDRGAADPEHADPWLMLVVLTTDGAPTDGAAAGAGGGGPQGVLGTRAGSPNQVLHVLDPTALPDPADAWAFAHVQVHDAASGAAAIAALSGPSPQSPSIRSRLLCPTRLAPDRGYLACVVPVYEAGRRVGLGLPETDAGTAVWTAAPGLLLPAYDAWTFRTGPAGDFETLARRLDPLTGVTLANLGLGLRQVTVEAAASLMQPADAAAPLFADAVRGFPTAIGQPVVDPPLAPGSTDPQAAPLQRRLKELVDIVAAATDEAPIVGPPLYGRWPAVVTSLDGDPGDPDLAPVPDATAQTWIEELNADPTQRGAAGLAATVVQRGSAELMRDAWSQLSTVLTANRRIRWAGVFATAATPLHERVAALPASGGLRVAAPALARLRPAGQAGPAGTATLRAEVDLSTLPRAVIGAAFTRAATRATALAVRTGPAAAPGSTAPGSTAPGSTAAGGPATPAVGTAGQLVAAAVDQLAASAPAVIPTRFATTRVLDPDALSAVLADPEITAGLLKTRQVDPKEFISGLLGTREVLKDLAAHAKDPGGVASQPPNGPSTVDTLLGLVRQDDRSYVTMTVEDRMRTAALGALRVPTAPLGSTLGTPGDTDVPLLRTAVDQIAKGAVPLGAPVEIPPAVPFDTGAAGRAVAALEPAAGYARLLSYAHQQLSDRVRQRSVIHPAMASPHFPAPLVDALAALDPGWVLGGVQRLPTNSICLLEVNWDFVEAFVTGANHQMARELLWRGYPTDLRGTCFDRFWPTVVPGTTEAAPDVAPLDSWTGHLGQHPASGVRHQLTVVVIKGDLLRRYPSTLISAERGTTTVAEGDTPFVSDGLVAPELFRGFLGADVSYSALDIPLPTLAEHPDGPGKPLHCWYISLLQPHDEPTFGLEDSTGEPGVAPTPNADTGGTNYAIADEWSWQGLADPTAARLTPAAVFDHGSSAVVGASLFRIPFRLLLRAPDYLPEGV